VRIRGSFKEELRVLTSFCGECYKFLVTKNTKIKTQRMLGTKIGTGGSSGHDYLKKTTDF